MLDGFEQDRIVTTGAEINLRNAGTGPPLLLLHGYPQTHVMWHKIAPALRVGPGLWLHLPIFFSR